ncbi:MAG: flagellin FliC [Nitrospina sp.]|jgi:flagellin|nr:flagellin FliC [Nitrospina sp.]MBT3856110.1 flagellin FliC [Nitrospina sp.]MBT4103223.1 flagellin FliC [Nitrospina sp.]MBT4388587.1 flagellin FliC [Nitrospina sp.]MBT4621594.1 flagellin FliC [Nitrospina sp.]
MPVRIFNNIASLNAQRILGINNDRLAQSVERISSGIRINRGADDAAGLAISEALRSDIRGLRQAVRNANDGIALINVAEGALNEQSSILIRLRELASQAATGTVGSTERATIQLEFTALRNEIDRIAATTQFNGQGLVDGSLASSAASSTQVLIQVGIDSGANSRINLNTEINLTAITSTSLGIDVVSVTAAAEALTTLDTINSAISNVTQARGKVGAVQNRLTRSVGNLSVSIENLQAAESSIRDADIAAEIANLTRNQILVQSATAMVGQANLIPQSILQLLA